MATMYDYLTWRGDITFNRSPLNEIDNLLFSILSYGRYDEIIPSLNEESAIPLSQAAEAYVKHTDGEEKKDESLGFFAEVPTLLQRAAQCKRFRKVKLTRFVNRLDPDQSTQFAAMVFSLGKKLHYIAFRGTDTSLIGWKEDLHMSFLDEIPAQRLAATYARQVFDSLEGRFILGGHSKGGNLAVYAAVNLPSEEQKRIVAVYNNDGPGFQSAFVNSDAYVSLLDRIKIFIPQSSIVGILLEHGGDYTVVGSKQRSILQHDPFSWEVEGTRFVYEEGLSKGVLAIKSAVRSWLTEVSRDERESFVKGFCELVGATGAKTLEDLNNDKLQSVSAILKAYTHMSKESKANLKKVMDILFKESRKSFKETLLEEIDHLLPKKHTKKTIDTDMTPQ